MSLKERPVLRDVLCQALGTELVKYSCHWPAVLSICQDNLFSVSYPPGVLAANTIPVTLPVEFYRLGVQDSDSGIKMKPWGLINSWQSHLTIFSEQCLGSS